MVNDADAAWTDLSRFVIRFDEPDQEMKLYANGNMQLKIIIEILAKDKNGDPVLLSENQLRFLRLVDADNSSSTDLGGGWSFTTEENRFNHTFTTAPSYYSSSENYTDDGGNGSDSNIQTRVLWVSTTQTGTKKISATILSTTSLRTFSSKGINESTVVCQGINQINYTPNSLKLEEEELARGTYIDESTLVIAISTEPNLREKDILHYNVYIKPVSGLRLVQAIYHFEAQDGRKLSLVQDSYTLMTPTGDWNGDKPEVKKDVYERETDSKFPLIPLKYDQHDNDLHLFHLWYFQAPEEFRDDWELPSAFISSYQGPASVGAEASYRRPFGMHISGNKEDDIDYEYRDHILHTITKITGNGQAGAICVSHVNFKQTNSAQAYKDINYLRENKVWISFVDEFGNSGAAELLIQDDKVKLTSHLLT